MHQRIGPIARHCCTKLYRVRRRIDALRKDLILRIRFACRFLNRMFRAAPGVNTNDDAYGYDMVRMRAQSGYFQYFGRS